MTVEGKINKALSKLRKALNSSECGIDFNPQTGWSVWHIKRIKIERGVFDTPMDAVNDTIKQLER